jgi:SAM-dependent methyltransferase
MAVTIMGIAQRLRELAFPTREERELIALAETLRGAVVLEPGGPSSLFGRRGLVPVYPRLAAVDTIDYAERTLWSAEAPPEIEPRQRVIAEASHLEQIPDGTYDALLASHVLEHLANPLGALEEWQRVVRPGGHILLIVPHRDGTFDHRRPVTSLEHLREDAARATGEDDLSHLEEILQLHDLERDPGAPNREVFEQRCRENPTSRAMHHHVFVSRSAIEVCRAVGLEVHLLALRAPFHIVCLCQVGADGGEALDDDELAGILSSSPFASDHESAATREPPGRVGRQRGDARSDS